MDHVHIIQQASKLFKGTWMTIIAFAFLAALSRFVGKQFACFGDQSATFTDISPFVLHTVWPLLKGLKDNTAGKNTLHIRSFGYCDSGLT